MERNDRGVKYIYGKEKTPIGTLVDEIREVLYKNGDSDTCGSALLTIISTSIYQSSNGNLKEAYATIDDFSKILKDGAIHYFQHTS